MRTIHKFILPPGTEFTVKMPRNSDILCVQMQRGALCMWAVVDTEHIEEERRISVLGTGRPMAEAVGRSDYIGTCQEGDFVWHVFATKPNALG